MLIDEEMVECVILDKRIVSDGYGGYKTVWNDGVKFPCAISFSSSGVTQIAEAISGNTVFTVTTKKNMILGIHDVFRRVSDGKIFRVTSDGSENATPKTSNLDIRQVNAEEWSLPND